MKNTVTTDDDAIQTPTVITTVVTKTSNWTRLGYFLLGVIVSAIMLYNVPSSANVAKNLVGVVVETTPKAIAGAADWVGDKVNNIGDGLGTPETSVKPVGTE